MTDTQGGQGGNADYPPVLDAAQVARLLQMNIDYVRKLSRERILPAHQLPGGRAYRYFQDEILDWLRQQPVGGPAMAVDIEQPSARGRKGS